MQCDRAMTATNATTSEASQIKVLVVDDEIVLADLLASALRYEGWEVTTAHTGADAVRLAREISPDLVVLDIMLPDFDGLEVLSKIRRNDPASNELVVGDLRMDEDSHEVWRGEDPIKLTATEFELLRFFMENPRRVLSKPQILDRVWDYDFGGQANVVELYVSYLRRKIDKGRAPMIHTVRGVGYMLKAAEEN